MNERICMQRKASDSIGLSLVERLKESPFVFNVAWDCAECIADFGLQESNSNNQDDIEYACITLTLRQETLKSLFTGFRFQSKKC